MIKVSENGGDDHHARAYQQHRRHVIPAVYETEERWRHLNVVDRYLLD